VWNLVRLVRLTCASRTKLVKSTKVVAIQRGAFKCVELGSIGSSHLRQPQARVRRAASPAAVLGAQLAHPLRADAVMLLSSAHAEVTALPNVDTKCTAPSLIPTVNGNTVRSSSTHGQQSAAQGSSTAASRSDISDIRLIQYLDSSALGWSGVALHWQLPYPLLPPAAHGAPTPPAHSAAAVRWRGSSLVGGLEETRTCCSFLHPVDLQCRLSVCLREEAGGLRAVLMAASTGAGAAASSGPLKPLVEQQATASAGSSGCQNRWSTSCAGHAVSSISSTGHGVLDPTCSNLGSRGSSPGGFCRLTITWHTLRSASCCMSRLASVAGTWPITLKPMACVFRPARVSPASAWEDAWTRGRRDAHRERRLQQQLLLPAHRREEFLHALRQQRGVTVSAVEHAGHGLRQPPPLRVGRRGRAVRPRGESASRRVGERRRQRGVAQQLQR
jgi:hypothetical protein